MEHVKILKSRRCPGRQGRPKGRLSPLRAKNRIIGKKKKVVLVTKIQGYSDQRIVVSPRGIGGTIDDF